uniref:Ig-like domain-containing protein n=1 Tax=Sinocyclocheilus grahami TaxID=75366 RepID=A0A672JXZ9_SINGR
MPGLVSCLGDLIVTGIIILFSDHVQSEIWTNEGTFCFYLGQSASGCGWVRRSPVEWQFNGSSVPPWQTHKGSLTLLNTTHSMEGNYSCHDERGTLLQSIKLRLGRKSASTIQESLVSCFDSQCDSFDKIFENKGLKNCLSVDAIFHLMYLLIFPQLETEDNTSLKIMDALVGHLHQIQIRAQDALINHSQWSEWSHVVEARPWIEPLDEPTEEPMDFSFPFFNLSFPVRTTDKSPDSSFHQNRSLGLLILLGLFAAVTVSVLLTIITLLRVRQRKQDNVKKQELASMVKMKSIPI